MFVVVQFPLADSRAFLGGEGLRLPVPVWPLPEPNKEFVRAFGSIQRRRRGGIAGWIGEELYCNASHALGFPIDASNGRERPELVPSCSFRRLFADGGAVCRVEVGFKPRSRVLISPRLSVLDIAKSCLAMRVRVPAPGRTRTYCDLQDAGRYLASHYLRATSRRGAGSEAAEDWWVRPGEPVILIECRHSDEPPPYSREVMDDRGVKLHYSRIERKGQRLGLWLLRVPSPDEAETEAGASVWDPGLSSMTFDLERRLRLHLLRLHAEREVLRQVLRLVTLRKFEVGRGIAASERLQEYFRAAANLLLGEKRRGIRQSDILDSVREFTELVDEGERDTLLASLQSIRGNILRSVRRLSEPKAHSAAATQVTNFGTLAVIHRQEGELVMAKKEHNPTVHGDYVGGHKTVGDGNIVESYNRNAADGGAVEEVRKKVAELSGLVEGLITRLPAEKAAEVRQDLGVFTGEAVKTAPRRNYLELSSKGLIEAAQTVGEMAGPVVEAVKAILTLLP